MIAPRKKKAQEMRDYVPVLEAQYKEDKARLMPRTQITLLGGVIGLIISVLTTVIQHVLV